MRGRNCGSGSNNGSHITRIADFVTNDSHRQLLLRVHCTRQWCHGCTHRHMSSRSLDLHRDTYGILCTRDITATHTDKQMFGLPKFKVRLGHSNTSDKVISINNSLKNIGILCSHKTTKASVVFFNFSTVEQLRNNYLFHRDCVSVKGKIWHRNKH